MNEMRAENVKDHVGGEVGNHGGFDSMLAVEPAEGDAEDAVYEGGVRDDRGVQGDAEGDGGGQMPRPNRTAAAMFAVQKAPATGKPVRIGKAAGGAR